MDNYMDEVQQLPESIVTDIPQTIDDIPSAVTTPTVKQDDIIFSSLLAGGDIVNKYREAKQEVSLTGQSTLVNNEQEKANKEHQATTTQTVKEIITDPSVPVEQKKQVAAYWQDALKQSVDLRDKYLVKTTTADHAITEEDRQAQDLYSGLVMSNDAIRKNSEAVSSIDKAAVTIADIFKGVGAVGAGMVLSIPAGYAGAFSWMLDNDLDKANEVIKDIQSYAYSPTSLGAQKVIDKIQKFMDMIDIPFKYIGDKTLDFTGSPAAATIAYTGSSFIGYLGAGKALSKGYKAVAKGKPQVEVTSPAGTIIEASPVAGNAVVATALSNDATAMALRTTKDKLVNSYVLPKLEEEYGPVVADAAEAITRHDVVLNKVFEETEFDPNVTNVTKLVADREAYLKIMAETSGPRLNLPSSMLESGIDGLKGKAVFGRNENYGYSTEMAADYALNQLVSATSHLPDPGKFSFKNTSTGRYIEWEFNTKNPDYAESLAFGADALSAHIISPKFDITRAANSIIGEKIWPAYMRMASWIPSKGATTHWKQGRIESKFLSAQRELIMDTNHPKELSDMIIQGDIEGKVYKATDFQAKYQHLSKAEVEKLHGEYVGYRRIQDHLYRFADRNFVNNLDKDGFQSLYNRKGNRVGFGKVQEDKTGIARVWDIIKEEAVDTPSDKPIIMLHDAVMSGNNIYKYAVMDKSFKLEPNSAGSLTKIPGYVARHYKEWYVLDRQHKEAYLNGYKVPAKDLRNYKSAVAMTGTKTEIEALKARFEKEHPEYEYVTRAEERDIADKIVFDSKVYDTYLKETHSRGEKLPSYTGEARVEDVLVSQTRSIQAVSRITAWDQIHEATRKNWVKAYGKFTEGKFPDKDGDITPLHKMSKQEELDYLAAHKTYQQLELQQFTSLPSDVMWKNTLNGIAEIFEKVKVVPTGPIHELAQKGNIPIRLAKSFGSNLWLYLRPNRMWAIQPQQWKEMMFLDNSFAKSVHELPAIWMGLISRTKTLESLRGTADAAGRRIVKDYDNVINAMEESGIMQAVDMNQMIHGIWKDTMQELYPHELGVVGRAMKKVGEGGSKVVKLPAKLGRAIGYDPAELLNQVSLWSFAKHRWETKNPGKDWNTPENKAQIASDQALYGHIASTRAGMYTWQEGMLSVFTQFAAIPFKSMMQMISAKEFTAAEKGKLAAARMFWYGKYGVPLGATIYALLERNVESEEDRMILDKWTEGFTNLYINEVLSYMFDDKKNEQMTSLDASKSLSTVPDNIWFYDVGKGLFDMARGEKAHTSIPFITASGAIYKAVQDVYDLWNIPPKAGNERDFKEMTWRAVTFAGIGSDFQKMLLVESLSKNGQSLGYKQTAGEAIARLAGISPKGERVLFEADKLMADQAKHIKKLATDIHDRITTLEKGDTPEQKAEYAEYVNNLKAYFSSIDPEYADAVEIEFFKISRQRTLDRTDSFFINRMRKHNGVLDNYTLDAINKMEKSPDPEVQRMLKEYKDKMQGVD